MNDLMTERLLRRLEQIGRSLEQSGKALALIGLGSAGSEGERLDEHSDLDFFAIVRDGQKTAFIDDLSWLSSLAPVMYAFQNTVDGFKLLFEDDVFCEFAVFETHELPGIPFAASRIIWKAPGVSEDIAVPAKAAAPSNHSLEWNLGEALTNLYIGLKRCARGEKLIAARFVQQYAVDRVLELAESLETAQNAFADPFNRERRFEQRYPGLAAQLPQFVQGYERTPESALAILDWLETHFEMSAGMARVIREMANRF